MVLYSGKRLVPGSLICLPKLPFDRYVSDFEQGSYTHIVISLLFSETFLLANFYNWGFILYTMQCSLVQWRLSYKYVLDTPCPYQLLLSTCPRGSCTWLSSIKLKKQNIQLSKWRYAFSLWIFNNESQNVFMINKKN